MTSASLAKGRVEGPAVSLSVLTQTLLGGFGELNAATSRGVPAHIRSILRPAGSKSQKCEIDKGWL